MKVAVAPGWLGMFYPDLSTGDLLTPAVHDRSPVVAAARACDHGELATAATQ